MLKKIKGRSWYFSSRINCGVYIAGQQAILIDSGIDEDYARKLFNALKKKGVGIKAVITTHAHADHYGGNALLESRSKCHVYAPAKENLIMRSPEFEPTYLFGAEPIQELRNKFFMAPSSRAEEVSEGQVIHELTIVSLPGHSMNLVGVRSPEHVLYASDAFFTEDVLEKYKIPYIFNVAKALSSLAMLRESKYEFFLLAHGGLLTREEAMSAIKKNQVTIMKVCNDIRAYLASARTTEDVLNYISHAYDLYTTVPQYYLNLSTIKAYLSYLKARKDISCFIENKRLFWKANDANDNLLPRTKVHRISSTQYKIFSEKKF